MDLKIHNINLPTSLSYVKFYRAPPFHEMYNQEERAIKISHDFSQEKAHEVKHEDKKISKFHGLSKIDKTSGCRSGIRSTNLVQSSLQRVSKRDEGMTNLRQAMTQLSPSQGTITWLIGNIEFNIVEFSPPDKPDGGVDPTDADPTDADPTNADPTDFNPDDADSIVVENYGNGFVYKADKEAGVLYVLSCSHICFAEELTKGKHISYPQSGYFYIRRQNDKHDGKFEIVEVILHPDYYQTLIDESILVDISIIVVKVDKDNV